MADAKAMKEAIDRGDNKTASALATDSLKRKVEINEFEMKGSGEDINVKATYTVHGPKGMEKKWLFQLFPFGDNRLAVSTRSDRL